MMGFIHGGLDAESYDRTYSDRDAGAAHLRLLPPAPADDAHAWPR